MGILNVTPDSFSDGGRFADPGRALAHALRMAEEGAALIDAFDLQQAIDFALTGGDDYELCFTAQPDTVAHIEGITAIGAITDSGTVVCRRAGEIVEVDDSGYRHFA